MTQAFISLRVSENAPTSSELTIRPVTPEDHKQWLPLWNSYNAFYERSGPTALAPEITAMTWARFFDADRIEEAGIKLIKGSPIEKPATDIGSTMNHIRPDLRPIYTRKICELVRDGLALKRRSELLSAALLNERMP
jgi:hypothetical protein